MGRLFTIFYPLPSTSTCFTFSDPDFWLPNQPSLKRWCFPRSKDLPVFCVWASLTPRPLRNLWLGQTSHRRPSDVTLGRTIFFAMEFFGAKLPKLSTFWRVLIGKFWKCQNSCFSSSLLLRLCQIGRNLAQKWMPGHLSTCAKIVFRPALQSPGGSTRELLAQQLLQCAACLLCWDLHLKKMKRLQYMFLQKLELGC